MAARKMHSQDRVEEYLANGFWTEETVQGLFADRVAERGDLLAAVDPLNKADLVDLPPNGRPGTRSPTRSNDSPP